MAWRIPTSSTTVGANIDIGTTDNVYIATGVTVGSTNSNAIVGTGGAHRILVYGTAVSLDNTIQILGNAVTEGSNDIYVGQGARLDCFGFVTIGIYGINNKITNAGYIHGDVYGIILQGQSAASVSTITNSGTLTADAWAISRDNSVATETLQINNTGLISGVLGAYNGRSGVGKEIISNTGTIVGQINLDGGDDVYNGINGHQTGQINGGAGLDKIYGGSENNVFHGDAGADVLMGYGGNDTLFGDADGDTLNGGTGADKLYGGTGLDYFVFTALKDTTVALAGRDSIFDFNHAEGDKINLAGIDARTGTVANEAFTFIGTGAFTGVKGQLHYSKTATATFVSGDVNGDKVADFMIHLAGQKTLVVSDFIL